MTAGNHGEGEKAREERQTRGEPEEEQERETRGENFLGLDTRMHRKKAKIFSKETETRNVSWNQHGKAQTQGKQVKWRGEEQRRNQEENEGN